MIKNYLKIAIRNLKRNKVFSAINVIGLSIGIATCLIIMLFVKDELSYDRFNEKADRIVRVVFKASINGGKIAEATVMPPTAQVLLQDFPEVKEATRIQTSGTPTIEYREKSFREGALGFADANFFEVFSIPMLQGNAKTALSQPNSMVITEEFAHKYFGDENPIGKVLNIKSWKTLYKVTGVIEKMPSNSHFHFDMLGSLVSNPDAKSSSWMSSGYFTYLVLQDGYDYKKLEAKLPQTVEKYMGPQIKQAMGVSISQFQKKGNKLGLFLQPLTDIHLKSDMTGELEANGDIRYVYIFGAIAIFMLIIACINFTNLSTAEASKRAREVGVRKVLGSVKYELIRQFLLESIVLTSIALVLAIALVQIALPTFNELSGKHLSIDIKEHYLLLLSLIPFGLLVGILAGSYPAFFLSSFKPVEVLKGKFSAGRGSISLRSGLVVFQFFISVSLIVGTIVVYQQLSYIQHKKLGYEKDQLLVLKGTWALGKNEDVLRKELLKDPRVVNVTTSGYKPAGDTDSNNSMAYAENDDTQMMRTLEYHIDDQYIPTMGMQMVSGRNFSKEFPTDSTGIIINESAAKAFGWGVNAVGHNITRLKNNDGLKIRYHVIGVVKNFHFKSLHESITPLLMVMESSPGLIVKVKTKDVSGLLNNIKKQWAAFNVDQPFSYAFMDEDFNNMYKVEQKTGTILGIFAALTIFVACLGLFGLATFTAEQRTKEIGIRKVLGADIPQIIGLLSKDFLKLILIACVMAFPLSYWTMSKWLQDFAYRIDISWFVFIVAGFSSAIIASLTISYQAIKAALANPVKTLRTE